MTEDSQEQCTRKQTGEKCFKKVVTAGKNSFCPAISGRTLLIMAARNHKHKTHRKVQLSCKKYQITYINNITFIQMTFKLLRRSNQQLTPNLLTFP